MGFRLEIIETSYILSSIQYYMILPQ
jgi:hypothetical protein